MQCTTDAWLPIDALPYRPSAHGVHSVRFASLHWPPAHVVHKLAPAELCLPAGQSTHAAAPDASSLHLPASHALHELSPAAGWALPAAQPVQASALAPLYVPTLQLKQPRAPVAFWNCPD
jgi:hypothetical protein